MAIGEKVRWYNIALGSLNDLHTPHWHGHTVLTEKQQRADEFEMQPGTSRAVDMVPDQAGVWSFHCHINDHLHAGMWSFYTVSGLELGGLELGGVTRTYYIAAVNTEWNYVGTATDALTVDQCSQQPLDSSGLKTITADGTNRIGATYTKALYREYTDATFSTMKTDGHMGGSNGHLGLLGPVIRAEVGDTVVVHYKNMANFSNSLHPHGVHYTKANEGAPYNDGTSGYKPDAVYCKSQKI